MDVEKLKKVDRIVTHGNCPDGMASAILLYDALGIEPEFVAYGHSDYTDMKATPNTLFCDISPPNERYKEWLGIGTIILDHHKSVKDLVSEFGEDGVFADEKEEPGVSGAVLAYREVWEPIFFSKNAILSDFERSESRHMKFAELAGIRDTWQKAHPLWRKSCEQAAALTFYPWEHWRGAINKDRFSFANEMLVGELVYAKRLENAKKCGDDSFKFEHDGLKIAVFNDIDRLTSDVAEMLREEGINIAVGFWFSKDAENPVISYSLRSDGSFDVSGMGEYFGGGGHTRAAGFSIDMTLEEHNPFSEFKEMFTEYVRFGK